MSRIALVVSDVDGTLVTNDKTLTDGSKRAVQRLREAGIDFTITSSRPPAGMKFLVDLLGLTLPIGPFNGSSIVDPQLRTIEENLIPEAAVRQSLALLTEFGVDIWLFTKEQWILRRDDGKYVPHEKKTVRFDPMVADFSAFMQDACKIVGVSDDADLLGRCEIEMQKALGNMASAIRSQSYYLDITPPGRDKGTFVHAMAERLNIVTDAVATIGDMRNDLSMFRVGGLSIAMGNASEDVKRQATYVTNSNEDEGFAGAVDIILKINGENR
jgi:Cof subfamily protein (haloacid dehalogenase superfamily)